MCSWKKSKYLELALYISFGVGADSSFATIFNKKESVSLYSGCTVYHVPKLLEEIDIEVDT